MIDNQPEVINGQELQSEIESIRNRCLNYHEYFDNEWKKEGRISYHNENHIRATLKTASFLVDEAFKRINSDDPLNLRKDLQKWNQLHQDEQITENEFDYVVQIAFACHDLGNITQLDENGEIVYLQGYIAAKAEERSQQIAQKIINESFLTDDQKRRFLPLVKHLIAQTTFQPTEEDLNQPFSIFTRVVDQIGGNLFNNQSIEDIVLGLVEENAYEKENFSFIPYNFFNFVRLRFPQLVSDQNKRNQILDIFGIKQLPEEIKVNENQIKIEKKTLEYLEELDKRLPLMYLQTLLLTDHEYKDFIFHDFNNIILTLGYLEFSFKEDNELQQLANDIRAILDIQKNNKNKSSQTSNIFPSLSLEQIEQLKSKLEILKTRFNNQVDNLADKIKTNLELSLVSLQIIQFLMNPNNDNFKQIAENQVDINLILSKLQPNSYSINKTDNVKLNYADSIIIFNLLKNAQRYNRNKIKINITDESDIEIINDSESNLPEEGLFTLKGKGKDKKSHTGYGLFIAQFLALSDGKIIVASSEKKTDGTYEIKFRLTKKQVKSSN